MLAALSAAAECEHLAHSTYLAHKCKAVLLSGTSGWCCLPPTGMHAALDVDRAQTCPQQHCWRTHVECLCTSPVETPHPTPTQPPIAFLGPHRTHRRCAELLNHAVSALTQCWATRLLRQCLGATWLPSVWLRLGKQPGSPGSLHVTPPATAQAGTCRSAHPPPSTNALAAQWLVADNLATPACHAQQQTDSRRRKRRCQQQRGPWQHLGGPPDQHTPA